VGERTASSISSWKTDWHIYKSSEVFLIGSIVILKGMKSSSASIWISIKISSSQHEVCHIITTRGWSHHHSTRLAHHHSTRLAHYTAIKMESQYWTGFMSQLSSWKHNTRLAFHHSNQVGSTIMDWLYVTAIKLEAQYLSCFTPQLSSWKHNTRLAFHHSYKVGSTILVLLFVTAIKLETRY
jgi:hypothetical protein